MLNYFIFSLSIKYHITSLLQDMKQSNWDTKYMQISCIIIVTALPIYKNLAKL